MKFGVKESTTGRCRGTVWNPKNCTFCEIWEYKQPAGAYPILTKFQGFPYPFLPSCPSLPSPLLLFFPPSPLFNSSFLSSLSHSLPSYPFLSSPLPSPPLALPFFAFPSLPFPPSSLLTQNLKFGIYGYPAGVAATRRCL